ncbi:cAMP-dependent protein kinase catalytic subunit, putative [Brugia malayi]|uniref:BMA-TBC-6 n=3 Tax=Brugia malayi TaxID=6279 RepID=A0A4E9EVS4_BRUMA|nr:cAMP-dependent protein kinase catalytic subunit, putative [Brugia malayi]VIO88462.1 cAMP-dependent protein kinase catalytic subunit, putative [Brugia malayi]
MVAALLMQHQQSHNTSNELLNESLSSASESFASTTIVGVRETGAACAVNSSAETELNGKVPEPVVSILMKMEQMNTSNELDSRSVASIRTGSSSSGGALTDSFSPRSNKSRENSVPVDDDEDLDLWAIWGNLIKNWEVEIRKRPNYIKELVRRGIPQHFRTIAWQLLSDANVSTVHDIYADCMRRSSPYEKVILRDIPRTYPELEFFKDNGRGQQALFNVIKAYSIHDSEVGYCQGSAFIVGQLLLQMPEEEAFAVFIRLMEAYRLRELFKPAMTELGLCMFQLECLVQEQMPDLCAHFNNMGFDTSMYASSWFLALFTTTLPLELANRIMDIFLAEGMEFIFRVAMAILQQARLDLLKLDMEGMLKYFQREVRERYENDHELLFVVANKVTLNAKKMKKLEKDYLTKRTKEQEEAIELRRLRTENRLLRQRIDYLEQESSALADRLIKGQVNLAQEAENCMSISHELLKLRDINSDAHRRLEEAYDTIRDLSCKKNEELTECATQVDDTSMIEHIHALQQDIIDTRAREADNEIIIKDLKLRIQELELANKRLRERPPDDGIAGLQEELISVKMREAEASLSLKEMRQRFAELEQHWTKYISNRILENDASKMCLEGRATLSNFNLQLNNIAANESQVITSNDKLSQQQPPTTVPQSARQRLAKLTATLIGTINAESSDTGVNASDSSGNMAIKELEDQLMGVRIREADTVAELKEMRQKVMELETQNHVCTNQLKRQDEEMKRLRDEKGDILQRQKELSDQIKEERRKAVEVESELKERSVMERLKYSEAMQHIADLKQAITHLELKKVEKWTHTQLRGSSICDLDDDSLTGAIGSHVSGDAVSITSDELTTLIADMQVRIPELSELSDKLVKENGIMPNCSNIKDQLKDDVLEEDGNDTTDSGFQTSDTS